MTGDLNTTNFSDGSALDSDYEAPDVDIVLTEESLDMERLYAGQVAPVGSVPA